MEFAGYGAKAGEEYFRQLRQQISSAIPPGLKDSIDVEVLHELDLVGPRHVLEPGQPIGIGIRMTDDVGFLPDDKLLEDRILEMREHP